MGRCPVQVHVRLRPAAEGKDEESLVRPADTRRVVVHASRKGCAKQQFEDVSFQFSTILAKASQDDVFCTCARHAVDHALQGFNSTIVCYGQTGAGKTYTMTGPNSLRARLRHPARRSLPGPRGSFQERGLIPRAISYIFRAAKNYHSLSVSVSYVEIYNEAIWDLLSQAPGMVLCGHLHRRHVQPRRVEPTGHWNTTGDHLDVGWLQVQRRQT
eukprot:scaffold707_cov399-Prasinococcus_capsulatus_cf.AAC.7